MLVKGMKDIVIVGAGPAGCYTAEKLADNGYNVTVLEKDPEIGNPMCCAGILGTEGLKNVGPDPKEWALNKLEGGIFYSADGKSSKLSRGKTEAYVIDRAQFDKDLAERAVRAGAEIWLNTRCTNIKQKRDKVELEIKNENNRKEIESRLVVGAGGTSSIVARTLDLIEEFSPIVCAQAEIVSKNANSHETKVYLGNDISQHFFGWITPVDGYYRVGLGDTSGNVVERLKNFVKGKEILPENAWNKKVRLTTGPIPKSNKRKIFGDRVLLVGDAAGHVKPSTGGGIYLGLACAQIAAETAAEALETKPSEEVLKKYPDMVNQEFGQEFQIGERVRNIYQKMSDEDISEFIDLLNEYEIQKMIIENAEFDHHAKLFKPMIQRGPKILKSMGPRKMAKYFKWFLDS